ncbi:CFF_collapsed_G0044890.mRNA.1.CDS.1 [Saccharomyces cerevisiae]|nr:CFF_collapsed_G0044890.mRNA.1.CDS.1 [Saccharomyces cerevisiae]
MLLPLNIPTPALVLPTTLALTPNNSATTTEGPTPTTSATTTANTNYTLMPLPLKVLTAIPREDATTKMTT